MVKIVGVEKRRTDVWSKFKGEREGEVKSKKIKRRSEVK
jgi:hypothetical protein